MIFWRKKTKDPAQEKQEKDETKALPDSSAPDSSAPVAERLVSEDPAPPAVSQDDAPQDDNMPQDDTPDVQESWLSRLTGGLSKSSTKLTQGIADLVTKKKLDQAMLDDLEELLIMADLGPRTAAKIVADFGKDRFGKDISEEEIRQALAAGITSLLAPVQSEMSFASPDHAGPFTVLVCGVNGVGKTTTIGKMAAALQSRQGKKIMIAAGDTFRAAAIEQLEIWAERARATLVKKEIGADAAAVAYEAYERAKAEGADVLFIDTAGRLHNKANLMAELEKIVRVLKKQDESLPHAVLLILDATTGQNAYEQVRIFKDIVNVTGLVVTKLDGSAKGGVVVGLADQFGLPIHLVGVGEGTEDLQPFRADAFARSLAGVES